MKSARMVIRSFLCLFILLLWLATTVFSQGLPAVAPEAVGLSLERLGRLDGLMQGTVDGKQISGAVSLIVRHGKAAYSKSYGVMDQGGKPMQPDTIFRIASMTNPITSVAVMMLMEEGRLDLEQKFRVLTYQAIVEQGAGVSGETRCPG